MAAGMGRCETVKALIEGGADVRARNTSGMAPFSGYTALMHAAQKCGVECVKELLAAGAELDAQDDQGETALMKAAFWGNRDVVSALLTARADPKIQDKEGRTAVTIAEKIGQTKIADLLRQTWLTPLD